MRTRNLDEAVEAVTRIYCPHTVEVRGRREDLDVGLEVTRASHQALVQLSYAVPVTIDAGDFPRLFLMMHCADGAASVRQQHSETELHKGQTLPFSAGLETHLEFDGSFVQRSIRLDADRMETLCGRWLGEPLKHPLRFAPKPFSEEFERIWQHTLSYLWRCEMSEFPLGDSARAGFDEYLLSLVLKHHEHNYSDDLARPQRAPVPGLVRKAEAYMKDYADQPMTISGIAEHVGVSVRTLEAGFRQWRGTTPGAAFRRVRLEFARQALLQPEAIDVTSVALRFGFAHLGRFGGYYQAAFGERPSATLRRGRRS